MIKIKKIFYTSAEILEYVDVLVTDNILELLCFADQCPFKEGQEIEILLNPLDVCNIEYSPTNSCKIKKNESSYFAYDVIGKVINKEKGIVQIGGFLIDLDSVPGYIRQDDFIKFTCNRLDFSKHNIIKPHLNVTKIKKISWLNDNHLKAKLVIADRLFNIDCFTPNSNYKLGDEFKGILQPIDTYNVAIYPETEIKVQKIEDTESAYEFIGCLIDKKKGLVQIGDFIFNLEGHIPEEATERGFISFECCRVGIQSS